MGAVPDLLTPHHSRPWRWVVLHTAEAKAALAAGMGQRWRADLGGDGVDPDRVDELVSSSRRRLEAAPALLLGCLTGDGLDRYPDEDRQRAEWGMALLALGAAVENLMLAATAGGLVGPRRVVAAPGPGARRVSRAELRAPGPPTRRPRRAAGPPLSHVDRRYARNHSRVRWVPSSSAVQGFQPRWIAARPGSSAERRSSPARGGA